MHAPRPAPADASPSSAVPGPHSTVPRPHSENSGPRPSVASRRPGLLWLVGGLLLGVAAFLAGAASGIDPLALVAALRPHAGEMAADGAAPATWPNGAGAPRDGSTWDGSITVTEEQQRTMGMRLAPVAAQTDPLALEVQGKTDYNPDTLLKVRPRFDALVLAVHATVGQQVRKGDPLVDLYSVKLAEAKLEYESKQSQAEHDKQIADHQRELVRGGVIPDASRALLDAVNLERRSLLEFKLARDELEVYGVPPEEIERVHLESGTEKAKMTLRATGDGTVISRDVVVGNIYDENDTLLVIASLEELWVWGNVYERDLARVEVGLPWEIRFPFSKDVVHGTIDYVANQVDPQTRALRIRGSIPNADGRLKSEQLVQVFVKNPPTPGSTVVPRRAVVFDSGETFVFVQRPGTNDVFERRPVEIEREHSDRVIVAEGIVPGETVVTVGGLMMAQIHEDRAAAESGDAG